MEAAMLLRYIRMKRRKGLVCDVSDTLSLLPALFMTSLIRILWGVGWGGGGGGGWMAALTVVFSRHSETSIF